MLTSVRISLFCLVGSILCSQTACNLVPYQTLRQSQLQALNLHRQNQAIAAKRDLASQTAQDFERRAAGLQSSLNTANQRVDNLKSGLSQVQDRYVSLLRRAQNQQSPLSDAATRRFEKLAEKYPGFEFDPQTGVSKFNSDILFASGSDQIKRGGRQALRDFAQILNEGESARLNILVVGHTDDKPIVKRATASKHPTNWHLSTNRANSVVLALKKSGIKENRMGAAGYSMHQPVVPNTNNKSRELNRRVEIFVLAPDAVVAGWEPHTSHN